jgi:hypothetical protein
MICTPQFCVRFEEEEEEEEEEEHHYCTDLKVSNFLCAVIPGWQGGCSGP